MTGRTSGVLNARTTKVFKLGRRGEVLDMELSTKRRRCERLKEAGESFADVPPSVRGARMIWRAYACWLDWASQSSL